MFCIHCGTELPDGAKYCWKCGKQTFDSAAHEAELLEEIAHEEYVEPVIREFSSREDFVANALAPWIAQQQEPVTAQEVKDAFLGFYPKSEKWLGTSTEETLDWACYHAYISKSPRLHVDLGGYTSREIDDGCYPKQTLYSWIGFDWQRFYDSLADYLIEQFLVPWMKTHPESRSYEDIRAGLGRSKRASSLMCVFPYSINRALDRRLIKSSYARGRFKHFTYARSRA